MEYFVSPPFSKSGGVCSDPMCPCSETPIPVGQGYLYISKELCDFRWDCRTEKELDAKIESIEKKTNRLAIFGPGMVSPILVCEAGAKLRQLDLKVAGQDAKHWWETGGQVPLRPTPLEGQPEVPFSKQAKSGGCFIATAAYGCALEPQVKTLCSFRDRVIRRFRFGRKFIQLYERWSPPFANWIAPRPVARAAVRLFVVRPCAALCARIVQPRGKGTEH
ncbi:MAG TPA: CFI-box-CTERM domain-containing protein [Candidatus Angelobacter sp.]